METHDRHRLERRVRRIDYVTGVVMLRVGGVFGLNALAGATLDHNSPVPLYYQAARLLDRTRRGHGSHSARLPRGLCAARLRSLLPQRHGWTAVREWKVKNDPDHDLLLG